MLQHAELNGMKVVGTASKKYRLYSEKGQAIGLFNDFHTAKRRMMERAEYMKTRRP